MCRDKKINIFIGFCEKIKYKKIFFNVKIRDRFLKRIIKNEFFYNTLLN